MPLAIGFLLLLSARNACAMGNPSVLYFLGGEILCLSAVAIRVVIAHKTWAIKGRALSTIFLGLVGIFMLHSIPDYLANQELIEIASITCLILASAIAIKTVNLK